jgi:hypothetical protein
MPYSTKYQSCFKSFKLILSKYAMLLFLFIGRIISQKRKEISEKLFGICEVLTIVKAEVLTKFGLTD